MLYDGFYLAEFASSQICINFIIPLYIGDGKVCVNKICAIAASVWQNVTQCDGRHLPRDMRHQGLGQLAVASDLSRMIWPTMWALLVLVSVANARKTSQLVSNARWSPVSDYPSNNVSLTLLLLVLVPPSLPCRLLVLYRSLLTEGITVCVIGLCGRLLVSVG